jgi:hypothetical protein
LSLLAAALTLILSTLALVAALLVLTSLFGLRTRLLAFAILTGVLAALTLLSARVPTSTLIVFLVSHVYAPWPWAF